jgi:hypothetical protein
MDELDKIIDRRRREVNSYRERAAALTAEAEAIKARIGESDATLRAAEIELRALEQAAKLRPIHVRVEAIGPAAIGPDLRVTAPVAHEQIPSFLAPEPKKRGGRKPGSISKTWRLALADLVCAGNNPLDPNQFYLLTRGRLGLNETSVRERIRQYAALGIMDEADGKYCVSATSIDKFQLVTLGTQTSSAPPAQAGEAVN